MKKIQIILLLLIQIYICDAQLDFRRDKTFDPPFCILNATDAAILEDKTIIVRYSGASILCTNNDKHSFLMRINSQDGSVYDDFNSEMHRSYPSYFTYIYPYFYSHGRGVPESSIRLHQDGWFDTSYFLLDLPHGLGRSSRDVLYLPQSDRILLAGSLNDSVAHSLDVHSNFLLLDRESNIDRSIRFPELTDPYPTPDHHNVNTATFELDEFHNKIYFISNARFADGHESFIFFRMDLNGNIDTTFSFSVSDPIQQFVRPNFDNIVYVQKNGKLILKGLFVIRKDGVDYAAPMIRLNLDGSYDTTFNALNSSIPYVEWEGDETVIRNFNIDELIYWKDGMYIITGGFIEYQGKPRKHIAVIDEDGHLVEEYFRDGQGFGFQPSTINPIIFRLMLSEPDTLYVAGALTIFDGEQTPSIIRLTLQDLSTNADDIELVNTEINVFPNPASDQLTVDISNIPVAQQGYLRIVNMQGMEVMHTPLQGNSQLQLNIQHLPLGLYHLQLYKHQRVIKTTSFVKGG